MNVFSGKKVAATAIGCLILATSLSGCSDEEQPYFGKWAYIHEDTETVLTLKSNGKGEFEGNKFTYTVEDDFLVFTDSEGNKESHRFQMDGDQMLFYEQETYSLDKSKTETNDGLIGCWVNDKKLSYEFTDNGSFMEDGHFPGHYTLDESNSSVKLAYNDHFADTVLYYSIDGEQLTVDYPWPMVHTKKD